MPGTRELTPVTSAAQPERTTTRASVGPETRLRLGEQLIASGGGAHQDLKDTKDHKVIG